MSTILFWCNLLVGMANFYFASRSFIGGLGRALSIVVGTMNIIAAIGLLDYAFGG